MIKQTIWTRAMSTHGSLPNTISMLRPIIKAKPSPDGMGQLMPVGQIEYFYYSFTGKPGDAIFRPPTGWLDCSDGKLHKRKEYPELAQVIGRRYTGVFDWYVLRKFRLPLLHARVGVDFGQSIEDLNR